MHGWYPFILSPRPKTNPSADCFVYWKRYTRQMRSGDKTNSPSVLSVSVLKCISTIFFFTFDAIIMRLCSTHLSTVQLTASLGTREHYHDGCTTMHLPVQASENCQESLRHTAHERGTSVSHIDVAWREESGQGLGVQTLGKNIHVHSETLVYTRV